jgi:hypothetical protein
MSADPYAWPAFDDLAGKLASAEAKLSRVQALMDEHAKKDGRVPVCQLRTAIGGAR